MNTWPLRNFLAGAMFAGIIWIPFTVGGSVPDAGCTFGDFGSVPVPDGLTAHLENPQLAFADDCTIFAATRPSSSVGGVVWMQRPGEDAQIVLTIDPRRMYALGEFVFDNRGRLYYATVPDPDPDRGGDNRSIDFYRVPGWPVR